MTDLVLRDAMDVLIRARRISAGKQASGAAGKDVAKALTGGSGGAVAGRCSQCRKSRWQEGLR